MKTHAVKGGEIISTMLNNFKMENENFSQILINIALYHHENIDGSGYPEGLKGDKIPVEARIVAVADVFDALTSERPYKQAWTNEQAYEELSLLANRKLDIRYVEAMIRKRDEIQEIQTCFRDETD